MSSSSTYHSVLTSDIIVNQLDLDEGCVLDLIEEARGNQTPDTHGLKLTTTAAAGDSGYSSRVSEVEGAGLLGEQRELAQRLTRISECQSNDEGCKCKSGPVFKVIIKVLGVFLMLYIFICTLDLLSNAFRLLGGKTAGSVFQESQLLANPITGLMIGVLSTVILQSSSTSSSIVITMVASNIMDIKPAIPIIMGANIGTTVTNTLVSLAHSMNHKEFRRAFSGAVVHDVFNWLTVLILLPLEYCTNYLFHLTKAIVSSLNLKDTHAKDQDFLMVLTKPLTSRIVQIDKDVITAIAQKKMDQADKPLLKVYCSYNVTQEHSLVNETSTDNSTGLLSWVMVNKTEERRIPAEKCETLFSMMDLNDTSSGIILFICSIIILSLCLYVMVKLLHSLLGGHIAKTARKTINADLPSPFHWLTGYVVLLVGAGMTILVQSSSVFTSALTPLVGIGCLKLERMYPLTLGSNIGTTFTGILAALASPRDSISVALQLAFCHLFFNITGILLFFPIPKMRLIVLNTAKYLGRTTAHYRWFAIAYLVFMFLVFPLLIFGLSFAGQIIFIVAAAVTAAIVVFVVLVNVMQKHTRLRKYLPVVLHTWDFLPECMRSLAPVDRCLSRAIVPFSRCCCSCCLKCCSCLSQPPDVDVGDIDSDDSDSESSVQSSYLPSVASSKIFLPSSKSGLDLKLVSARIYKPGSRRNSLGKRPPAVKPDAVITSVTVSLLEDYKPRSQPDDGDRGATEENMRVDISKLKESII